MGRASRRKRRTERQTQGRQFPKLVVIGSVVFIILAVVLIITQGVCQPQTTQFSEDYFMKLVTQTVSVGHPNETVSRILEERYRFVEEKRNEDIEWLIAVSSYSAGKRVLSTVRDEVRDEGRVIWITFFRPTIEELFYLSLADQGGINRQRFENSMVIGHIHELDHLVFDTTEPPYDTLEKRIDSEALTWAKTAESIELIRRTSEFPLIPPDEELYRTWLNSGGRVDSPAWRNRIESIYAR